PWLRQVSREVELPCNKIAVRGQKTIWASCSSKKNISLNYKLMFLPPELVRYVFIHELCHTAHLNHSENFWAFVEEKAPDYQLYDTELNKAWCYIPPWIERSDD
ncbi:MAG: M48 family metallopeptidase, partial [Leptolyngbyaceae cyanobacterium CRU_2_3]|nr:M48 family metallopeptidase [Leptolyngbyaceae cyanobacterium CRU_2_3]